MSEVTTSGRASAVVGLASMAVVAVISALALNAAGWDATVFVGFGEDAAPTREYAEDLLGEVILRPSQGHDGKYFFVQANDPLLLDPANHASVLDLPAYRSQRMLYPLIAGGAGLFSPEVTVWGLFVVSLLALGAGTYATSRLAIVIGGSAWWGLAFGLNIGFLYSLTSDVSDVLAAALGVAGVLLLYERRHIGAIALLSASSLSREVMILCALGAAVWLWFEGRKKWALATLAVPAAIQVGWMLYISARLGPDPTGARALGLPFVGIVEAVPRWLDKPVTLAAAIGVLFLLGVFLVRWWQTRTLLGWAYIGFLPLAAILTDKVWTSVFDFTRAVAPALTAAVLVVFLESKTGDRRNQDRHSHASA